MGFEKVEYTFPDEEDDESVDIEIESSSMKSVDDDDYETAEPEETEEKAEAEVVAPKDDIEIEIVDDTPEEDRGREPSEPPEDVTEDELKGYSEKVRKRIQRFTKGYHDERRAKETALRERTELENYARKIMQENEELKGTVGKNQAAILEQAKRTITLELDSAKAEYLEAHESGNSQALLDAQEKLTNAKIRSDKVNSIKLPSLQDQKDTVQREQSVETTQQEVSTPTPRVDQKARDWAEDNTWFGTDEEMTGFALVVHNKLVNGGVSPQSEEYYEKINSRMRQVFPENFEGTATEEDKPKRKSQIVAPATRSTAPKSVKLTRSQVAIAKRLGVPLEMYAKQVAEEIRKGNG